MGNYLQRINRFLIINGCSDLYGLIENKIQRDGNCQFRSLSDHLYRSKEHHNSIRDQVVNEKRGGRDNQPPPKPKKAPNAQPESEEAVALPTSSTSSSSENEDNEAAGKAPGPSRPRTTVTSAVATNTKNAGNTELVQKTISSPIVNPTQSTTKVEAEPMQVEAMEAESRNENLNPEGPKETVMEQTIKVTRVRLRKMRSEERR